MGEERELDGKERDRLSERVMGRRVGGRIEMEREEV